MALPVLPLVPAFRMVLDVPGLDILCPHASLAFFGHGERPKAVPATKIVRVSLQLDMTPTEEDLEEIIAKNGFDPFDQ